MKNLKAPFLVIALLLNVLIMSAGSAHPPVPVTSGSTAKTANATSAADCEDPELPSCNPEANMPIDQHVVFLLLGGLALGATVIYKSQIKKASI
ncbi:hypothetical protein [Flavobacterium humidisoli]|uniref:LPXTG cell wall anchor domain-containing protein n=1 Tax=Flavobacterium humidisoli TaxID=2937442 RepID=A0ABY4LUA0_9FLAO|nr:hypothetical protein [Flavobacterium humidisoli]UPZ16402.1 hypothetical protein M0M44_03460 [Flavobacterium humidisoli]